MSNMTDEMVVAYIDGRLSSSEVAAFEQSLTQAPELAKRVADHRWLAERIVAAFGPAPIDEPAGPSGVIPFVSRRALRVRNMKTSWWIQASAIAATLVLGIFVGSADLGRQEPFVTVAGGELLASGPLANSLTNATSSGEGTFPVGLTFRTAQGFCRTFTTPQGMSGLGCREAENWFVIALIGRPVEPGAVGEYRLAGAAVDPGIMSEVDRIIVGEPIPPAEEVMLIRDGWKSKPSQQ
jgi:hypothetical protein